MAFKKQISIPSGVSGQYIRVAAFRWDRAAREASVLFALYRDVQAAEEAPDSPLVPVVAKLRLTGSAFAEHLGTAQPGNMLARIYQAARSEPIISDHGPDVFADAEDV